MNDLRKVYFSEKKRQFKRYLGRVGLAYGLLVLVGFAARIFSDQKKAKHSE